MVFRLTPLTTNIARRIKKATKYYFYDVAPVEGAESAQIENLVALSLKKQLDFINDTEGHSSSLHFVRTKDGNKIEMLIRLTPEAA